ncbi:MAG: type II toxin-antitoxin system RelE/ParE family toxin [Thermoproteota archaeon]
MPYRAALTKSFLRELKKLPEDVRNRVLRAVDEILANPLSGIRLKGELEGLWRWRVGKYRIIYRVEQASQTVILLDVGLRKAIYE